MSDHIGDRLAQRHGEDVGDLARRFGRCFIDLEARLYVGRVQRRSGIVELFDKAGTAITLHRLADLTQSLPGDSFDLVDFLLGSVGIAADELRGHTRF